MTDYVYNDEFDGISGIIDGSDFHQHHVDIEAAILSKGNKAGPVTWTGVHTYEEIVVTTITIQDMVVTGTLDATGVPTAQFAAITASGAIAGATLAGSADLTAIDGGVWA